ncbi:MAG: M36 family metallopeptidase [Myxococcales bacterium]|nr:M36 family metallopeptidase [Myxococcales bacterium]
MIRNRTLNKLLLSAASFCFAACASGAYEETKEDDADGQREYAVEALQLRAGGPVKLELNEAGVTRVLAMTPRFSLASRNGDPAEAAKTFLRENHEAFKLSAAEAESFLVGRVDVEPISGRRHVTLNSAYNGIPVFQGGVAVHMGTGNEVYRAVADEFYNISAPTNRQVLSVNDAATAAGRAFGLDLALSIASSDDVGTTFTADGLLDPMVVTPKIFQVAPGDNRFAYQVTVSRLDEQKTQQYDLVLLDQMTGDVLFSDSLVDTFTGRVFTQSPGFPAVDNRTVVSFDGNPAASPQGWVNASRRTVGNNAVAQTDLNANNVGGANETQPTANASDAFDFPYSPTQNAANFKENAVATAFFLTNDYHDRTYLYGFTETAGNFQTSNFGLGGAQNDEVQVDSQDGSGTNNANFATPPDGSRPRMQMFNFNIINGQLRENSDLDPGIIYHEYSHGLSNRLVGGGSTACLNGSQSGGMGEGWGDFLGASFLNDPVVGAYVTGDNVRGIRDFSMANSPVTYAQIKDGSRTQVHAAGEIWAATLWDVRTAIGATKIEQLVVAGLKLTPCNPTMLQARDAILQADVNINAGANRCVIFSKFAARQMGTGASSPNHNSTAAIVLSTAVPPECGGGGGGNVVRDFVSTDVPKNIPDNNATGVNSVVSVPAGLDNLKVTVDTNITHTFRGDLIIQVVAPNGQTATLSNRAGGSADNFIANGLDISSAFTPGSSASGTWRLFVRDVARIDIGRINSFVLHVTSTN